MPATRLQRCLLVTLFAVGLLRLVSLGAPALVDSTEGRYGATALQMLVSGDWVTPKIPLERGFEPYLGKPPLHFWAMAASLGVFGRNAWAARLPSFLAAVAMVWTSMAYAAHRFGRTTGWLSGLILATSALYFLLSGAVNLDVTLAATVNLAIVAFCRVAEAEPRNRRLWGYLFFASLGLGFLTKGPIAIALTGLAGIAHLLVFRNARVVTGLPWLGGTLLFLAISVPWFVIAEQRNPGFLQYFFVHENLERFTRAEYGDRYGSGRVHFPGSSWLFLLLGTLPWSVVPIVAACTPRWRARARAAWRSESGFLLLWAVSPAALFSLARNSRRTTCCLASARSRSSRASGREARRRCAWIGLRLLRPHRRRRTVHAPITLIVGVIYLDAGLYRSVLALLLAAVVGVLQTTRAAPHQDALEALAHAAVAITATYMIAWGVSAPFISDNRSTGPIIDRFVAARPAGAHRLGLVFGRPFSAVLLRPGRERRADHLHAHRPAPTRRRSDRRPAGQDGRPEAPAERSAGRVSRRRPDRRLDVADAPVIGRPPGSQVPDRVQRALDAAPCPWQWLTAGRIGSPEKQLSRASGPPDREGVDL